MFHVDDNFPDGKKVEDLAARYPKLFEKCIVLWLFGGCFCARTGSDGAISEARIRALHPRLRVSKRHINALIDVGLLIRFGDYLQYHDYADWNETKAEKAERLRKNRERQQRYRDHQNDNVTENVTRDITRDITVTSRPYTLTNTLTSTKLSGGVNSQDLEHTTPPPTPSESPPKELPNWRQPPVTWASVYLCLQELTGFQADPSYHKQHLESIARQCCSQPDPVSTLETVVTRKKAQVAKNGKRVDPKWLATDFDQLLFSSPDGSGPDPLSNDKTYQELLRDFEQSEVGPDRDRAQIKLYNYKNHLGEA